MKLNVWIYYNDDRYNDRFSNFPYIAESVLQPGVDKEYKNIDDVYDELLRLEKKTIENGGDVGQGLYNVLPFFVNDEKLVSLNMYNDILKVNYVKSSKTPPYANLQETPAQFVNNYMIISNEIQTIMSEKQKSEK